MFPLPLQLWFLQAQPITWSSQSLKSALLARLRLLLKGEVSTLQSSVL